MFDFLRSRFMRQRKRTQPREQVRPGVQLLASMLICFPEIEAVSYDPHEGWLTMDFVIREHVSTEEIKEFTALLAESIETYHVIEDGLASAMNLAYECHENLTILHISWKMDELSQMEMSLIVHLMTERFGAKLCIDPHGADALDSEFGFIQHETLERMLSAIHELPLRERLVGIRERDQVVVYNR